MCFSASNLLRGNFYLGYDSLNNAANQPYLHLDDGAGEHAAADGHVAGEGALLVNVVALARLYKIAVRKLGGKFEYLNNSLKS